MSAPRQRTISSETGLEGIGLHSGERASLRFLPAAPDTGLRFRRTDLPGRPEVAVDLDNVESTDRGTTLAAGEARAGTVEHLLAAIAALEIDNLVIELSGPEVPILDGSFRPFHEALLDAGPVEQGRPATILRIGRTITVEGPRGGRYTCEPAHGLTLSATIEFDHPLIRHQHASFELSGDVFRRELAPARTFGFLREAEALQARGLAQGATLENAIVLDEEGLASEGPLRFDDEFVRHKIGDVLGDLAITGARVRGHIVAERPSHAGNLALARELLRMNSTDGTAVFDAGDILEILPHRYPMLLVDRILEFEAGERIVGVKNVTLNEPFFQGHFPGHPVMPGVLILEAMAQVGGMMLMELVDDGDQKVPYFASADRVKWRRPVRPGDQLRIEVESLQIRRDVCKMQAVATVDGAVVAEAQMLARIVDA